MYTKSTEFVENLPFSYITISFFLYPLITFSYITGSERQMPLRSKENMHFLAQNINHVYYLVQFLMNFETNLF